MASFSGLLFFAACANKFYFYQQGMYIVFILQCQKVYKNCQILLKRAETRVALTVSKGIDCCLSSLGLLTVVFQVWAYTVAIYYHSVYMIQEEPFITVQFT